MKTGMILIAAGIVIMVLSFFVVGISIQQQIEIDVSQQIESRETTSTPYQCKPCDTESVSLHKAMASIGQLALEFWHCKRVPSHKRLLGPGCGWFVSVHDRGRVKHFRCEGRSGDRDKDPGDRYDYLDHVFNQWMYK